MLRVGDDLEVVPAGAGRALDARRRELDARPAGARVPRGRAAWSRTPDPPVGDDEILDAAVRLERGAQLGVAHPGDDEVVLRRTGSPSSSSRTAPPTA